MSLFSIITSFSKEESDLFIQYIRSRNKRKDTKNTELYMLLRKGVPVNDIITTLYGSSNRNAYHALSKRLQDSLIDFIATRSFETETSEDMTVFKWILTARILYEQDQIDPAHKLLKKAIKRAKQLDLYTALVEAYHTQIQYSHLHPEQDLPELVAAAQQCHKPFYSKKGSIWHMLTLREPSSLTQPYYNKEYKKL
jgi:NAD-dependent SIR2 family protein deacetylase